MIRTYLNPQGKKMWEAYVNIRKSKSGIRVQRKLKGFETEAAAKKAENGLLRECERIILSIENKDITWNDLLENYEQSLKLDSSSELNKYTQMDYIATVRKYTKEWLERESSSITYYEARQLFNNLATTLSHSHLSKLKMILTRVFKFGLDSKLIKNSALIPTADVKLPKKVEKPPEILTIVEIKKLLSTAKGIDHKWYSIWAMALLTGMRNGELFALTWDDIDFNSKILTVSKSFSKRTREVKSTKAGYWRHVPISSELETLLKELKLKSNGNIHVLPRIRNWERGYQAEELRAYCTSIGIPSVRFHTLRACFATQLLRQGIPAAQVQKICGWRDLETMQRYIRLAGIEVAGATEGLKFLPDDQVMAEVIPLFAP